MAEGKRIIIAGSSGFLGRELARQAKLFGWNITSLVRSGSTQLSESVWNPSRGEINPQVIAGADGVICLNGTPIASGLLTPKRRRMLAVSRIHPVKLLADTIAELPSSQRPKVFISASAIGFYGDRGQELLTERATAGQGFLPLLCSHWEMAAESAEEAGVRVVHPRFGLIWGKSGGLAKTVLPLYEARLGVRFGSGRQFQPLVSLRDTVSALLWAITNPVQGPINVVAPQQMTHGDWHEMLQSILGKSSVAWAPASILRMLPGGVGKEMLLPSQRVVPEVLSEGGFQFSHSSCEQVLRAGLE